METCRKFDEEERKNWLKVVFALSFLQEALERFIDEQIESFHRELCGVLGADVCVKKCDFSNWKAQTQRIPPLNCEVCSAWRDAILTILTSPHGKVFWKNSEPHLWSQEKWEVAKVFMTNGHKNHKSVGDFDIAALLCLMTQCRYFQKFELGELCEKVSTVRNSIMHSARFQLKWNILCLYLDQIRALGEKLAEHDPKFESLSKNIDEIQNLDFRLVLLDNMAAEKPHAQREKELDDIISAVAQMAVKCSCTRMMLGRLDGKMAQLISETKHLIGEIQNRVLQSVRLKRQDLHCYLPSVRALAEELAKFDPEFKILTEDITEILNPDSRLDLPDNMAAKEIQAQHEKEGKDILDHAVQLVRENHNVQNSLWKLEQLLSERGKGCISNLYMFQNDITSILDRTGSRSGASC